MPNISQTPFGLTTMAPQFTTTSFQPQLTRPTPTPDFNGQLQVKIGLLFSNNSDFIRSLMGFGQSTPAIQLALRDISAQQLIPNVNLTFQWYMDNCEESRAAGLASRLITTDNVNVIIGPACPKSMVSASSLATFNNVPLILWGPPFPAELANAQRFPTLMSVSVTTESIGVGVFGLMQQFDWKEFALVYTVYDSVRICDYVQLGIQNVFDDQAIDVNITYKRSIQSTNDSFLQVLQVIRQKARVIVSCFDNSADIRKFLLAAYDLDMYSDEYVYVILSVTTQGGLVKTNGTLAEYWKSSNNSIDGRDDDALVVARRAILFGVGNENTNLVEEFDSQVEQNFNQYPFFCDSTCMGNQNEASTYSRYLYDAVYLYALALNQTLQRGNSSALLDGSLIANNRSFQFNGTTGLVNITKNGTRQPIFNIVALDKNNTLTSYASLNVHGYKNVTFLSLYDDEENGIWTARDGQRPTGRPKCGYSGMECVLGTGIIIGVAAGAVIIIFLIGGALVAYFLRLNGRFPYIHLTKVEVQQMENLKIVYANKHPFRVKITKSDINLLRQLRNFDHDNANRFMGLCVDGPIIYSVWKYCQRGSLQDVLMKEGYIRDQFVMFALMRDISNGLNAIHNSYIEVHGALSSDCCLINDRWQVKIGNFGLGIIREKQQWRKKDQLWTAPELLRNSNLHGTKAGDVFSYAIICSELLNRECAWHSVSAEDEIDDIIFRLKRGGSNPYRPAIQPPDEVNDNIINLVKDCWDERPENRPDMSQVCLMLKQLLNNGKSNLMDYVFSMLEQYASSLEHEVELRTKELMEEKRKSDILLYRMLPQQVADKLKLGMVVEPESYDAVTVFFSDVVSFTSLAGLCSPLQVVNLLNDLYTVFDGIIEQCDAYKLETIGGRLFGPCVAGVVGLSMPKYCLFGDTINTASRMETNSKPGKIHISSSANHYLMEANDGFVTESRGEILIKGKGMMETYWLIGRGSSIEMLIERVPSTPSTEPMTTVEYQAVSPHIVANPAVAKSADHLLCT
ncbi:Guanylate cyclase [Aphelenchoides bicaudatus]|nr:Guanylate cyclase [Aphelenchoides bicaudatus]